jgi:integrase
LLNEIGAITKNPQVADQSRELFRRLMEQTSGELLAGANFNDYCEEWLTARATATAPATMAKYRKAINDFIGSLDQHRRTASVQSITSREVLKYRDGLVSKGVAESTANIALAIVRSVFNDARKQGVILANPAEAVKSLKAHDTDARVPFSVEQVRALYAAADQQWRGMILLGVHAGLRIGDAANLRWSNVDLVKRTVSFEQKKVAHRKKKHQRLTVIYLHDDLVAYLETIVPGSDNPNAALFPSLAGLPTAGSFGLSTRFADVMKKAAIVAPVGQVKTGRGRVFKALSFHSLRHSFVSRLANAEVAMEIRKQMSGHSSDQIHEGYSHLSLSLQRQAIAKLGSVL